MPKVFAALRPKQWAKNILLFVAPFAAGVDSMSAWFTVFLGFAGFCVASSIGYVLNDMKDMAIDREHPRKRNRPFASGDLSSKFGFTLVLVLASSLPFLLHSLPKMFTWIVVVYIINTALYTILLKQVPVIEMFFVAFGFVLRLIAGALVLNLAISEWFLIIGGFGALFVVCTKRLAELKQNKEQIVRKVVNDYSYDFLNSSSNICVAVCIASYCFWAFDQNSGSIWYQISIVPFVMGLYRFIWMTEKTIIDAPEDALLSDLYIILNALAIVFFLSIAIYQ
jgi:decaprenyl-phosphate phosphoribosyltransferase